MATEKKRGRPAQFDEPMHPVSTRLPQSLHDALMRLALRRDQSVHEVVRQVVVREILSPRQGEPRRDGSFSARRNCQSIVSPS